MVVELISVGTEILLGNIVNTNANYLARKCAQLSLSNYFQISVGDNEERLATVLQTALNRSDIVILTGGLGPTKDDLTKEVTAKTLGKNLEIDTHTKNRITTYFKEIQAEEIPENNWKQAIIIEDSIVVDNNNGTAPGLIVKTEEGKTIILLPGPPNELIPMFENDICPFLSSKQPNRFYSEMVKICGIGESKVETMICDLIEQQTNPTIAPYAKTGEVHLRVTASAKDIEEGQAFVKPIVEELRNRFNHHIYTTNENDSLESVVVSLLKKYNLTLSTAESCTGGLLAGRIINVPGVSEVIGEGFITYSNEAKMKYLNVKKETLQQFGAVSKETAREMAVGVRKVSGSNISIAITGLAGPGGETDKKPVGLVYIACSIEDNTIVNEYHFNGNRDKIRESTVVFGLTLLRSLVLEEYELT